MPPANLALPDDSRSGADYGLTILDGAVARAYHFASSIPRGTANVSSRAWLRRAGVLQTDVLMNSRRAALINRLAGTVVPRPASRTRRDC